MTAVEQVSVETEISAAPEALYDMVSDLPRMGEWSPECERVTWGGGARAAAPGVQFTGHNRNGARQWSTHGTVTVADRGREFSFEIRSVFNLPVSLWTYRFSEGASGTHVVETTEDRRGWLIRNLGRMATGVADRATRNRETMTVTLQRLKEAAEAAR